MPRLLLKEPEQRLPYTVLVQRWLMSSRSLLNVPQTLQTTKGLGFFTLRMFDSLRLHPIASLPMPRALALRLAADTATPGRSRSGLKCVVPMPK
jgi:hypothetical protein